MKITKNVLLAMSSMLLGAGLTPVRAAEADRPSYAKYQPTLDITQDPGCSSKKKRQGAQRVAYNRKLAELYFLNFQEAARRGRNYSWWSYGCMADGATMLLGAAEPTAEPMKMPPSSPAAQQMAVKLNPEERGYYSVFPPPDGFGPLPGTLVVIPNENGAFFRMMYGGKDKDGKFDGIWETNYIVVNEEGQITHFEMWNDSIAFDRISKRIFGTGIEGLGLAGYIKALQDYAQKHPQ
jgi:hypothetical protein